MKSKEELMKKNKKKELKNEEIKKKG